MPGPPPKPPGQRRRRNVVAGARTLVQVDIDAPPLPERERGWHQMTLDAWASWWASPMAAEWDDADLPGLYVLADLTDAFWRTPPDKATGRKDLAGEIRLQRQCFGLTPIDRRRLQWEIDRGDEASAKTTARRRTAGDAQSARPSGADPRLSVVRSS